MSRPGADGGVFDDQRRKALGAGVDRCGHPRRAAADHEEINVRVIADGDVQTELSRDGERGGVVEHFALAECHRRSGRSNGAGGGGLVALRRVERDRSKGNPVSAEENCRPLHRRIRLGPD